MSRGLNLTLLILSFERISWHKPFLSKHFGIVPGRAGWRYLTQKGGGRSGCLVPCLEVFTPAGSATTGAGQRMLCVPCQSLGPAGEVVAWLRLEVTWMWPRQGKTQQSVTLRSFAYLFCLKSG